MNAAAIGVFRDPQLIEYVAHIDMEVGVDQCLCRNNHTPLQIIFDSLSPNESEQGRYASYGVTACYTSHGD